MTEFLHDWIMHLAAAAIISACAMAITPEGRTKTAVKVVCGVISMMALISPINKIELAAVSVIFEEYRVQAMAVSEDLSGVNEKISKDIIESETASYISEGGKNIGADIQSVSVSAMKKEDGYYYPHDVEIKGDISESDRDKLLQYINDELGISSENVIWSSTDEE